MSYNKVRHCITDNHVTISHLRGGRSWLVSNMLQSNAANNMMTHGELHTHLVVLSRRIFAPAIVRHSSTEQFCDFDISSGFCLLPFDAIELGANFQYKLEHLGLSQDQNLNMKIKAFFFINELSLDLWGCIKGSISLFSKTNHFQLPISLKKP